MTYSYEGIGQVVATFMAGEPVAEGQIVQISATESVGACRAEVSLSPQRSQMPST